MPLSGAGGMVPAHAVGLRDLQPGGCEVGVPKGVLCFWFRSYEKALQLMADARQAGAGVVLFANKWAGDSWQGCQAVLSGCEPWERGRGELPRCLRQGHPTTGGLGGRCHIGGVPGLLCGRLVALGCGKAAGRRGSSACHLRFAAAQEEQEPEGPTVQEEDAPGAPLGCKAEAWPRVRRQGRQAELHRQRLRLREAAKAT